MKTAIGPHGMEGLALTVYDKSNRTKNIGSRLASMRPANCSSYRARVELAGSTGARIGIISAGNATRRERHADEMTRTGDP
jgi:hypothetical protein